MRGSSVLYGYTMCTVQYVKRKDPVIDDKDPLTVGRSGHSTDPVITVGEQPLLGSGAPLLGGVGGEALKLVLASKSARLARQRNAKSVWLRHHDQRSAWVAR